MNLRRAAFLAPLAVSGLFFINLCSLIFQCGCRSWWAGAAAHCNIHHAGGRHCPWCSHGEIGFYGVLLLVLVPQMVLSFYPARVDWRARLLASFTAFPAIGVAAAWASGWADRYWN